MMKNKDIGYDEISSKVLFYRMGKSYYFSFENKSYICDSININKLKERLVLPYKISFSGMSRAQIFKVISRFIDDNVNVKLKDTTKKNDKTFHFEALFCLSPKRLDEYKEILENKQVSRVLKK